MKVVWSNRALRSLANIHGYISAESAEAANRTIDVILKRGDQLAAFPQLGRVVDRYKRPGIREWSKHHTASFTEYGATVSR